MPSNTKTKRRMKKIIENLDNYDTRELQNGIRYLKESL